MSRGLHLRSVWIRTALLLLAMCALSSRFVVPAGFMPESGKIALSICSGKGQVAPVWIDTGKTQHKGDPADGDHSPCSFSSSAAPMLSAAPSVLLASAILYVIAQSKLPDVRLPAPAPDRLRPPLRGPPSV